MSQGTPVDRLLADARATRLVVLPVHRLRHDGEVLVAEVGADEALAARAAADLTDALQRRQPQPLMVLAARIGPLQEADARHLRRRVEEHQRADRVVVGPLAHHLELALVLAAAAVDDRERHALAAIRPVPFAAVQGARLVERGTRRVVAARRPRRRSAPPSRTARAPGDAPRSRRGAPAPLVPQQPTVDVLDARHRGHRPGHRLQHLGAPSPAAAPAAPRSSARSRR